MNSSMSPDIFENPILGMPTGEEPGSIEFKKPTEGFETIRASKHKSDPLGEKRAATAAWHGGLKEGRGSITTQSRALTKMPYSYHTRFHDERGTNPEELIAAAHAGCFTMALAGELEKIKLVADAIETVASVEWEKTTEGWTVTEVHLKVTAQIARATERQFTQAAEIAKNNCPISRLLRTRITLETGLISEPSSSLEKTG